MVSSDFSMNKYLGEDRATSERYAWAAGWVPSASSTSAAEL